MADQQKGEHDQIDDEYVVKGVAVHAGKGGQVDNQKGDNEFDAVGEACFAVVLAGAGAGKALGIKVEGGGDFPVADGAAAAPG